MASRCCVRGCMRVRVDTVAAHARWAVLSKFDVFRFEGLMDVLRARFVCTREPWLPHPCCVVHSRRRCRRCRRMPVGAKADHISFV